MAQKIIEYRPGFASKDVDDPIHGTARILFARQPIQYKDNDKYKDRRRAGRGARKA